MIKKGKKMITKKIPINILLSEEINDGLNDVGEKLGFNKSRTIRFICFDYLTKNKILVNEEINIYQNL
jgi:hypothetical protein